MGSSSAPSPRAGEGRDEGDFRSLRISESAQASFIFESAGATATTLTRRAWRGVLSRGRERGKKIPSRGAHASELCRRTTRMSASRLSRGGPRARPFPKRREAERRQAHPTMSAPHFPMSPSENVPGAAARHAIGCCHPAALRARSPLGAPPRLSSQGERCRLRPRPRFTRSRGRRRYPRRRSRLSQAPGSPVVVPAGTMPGPPGSGATSPARRNRTRSASRTVSRSVPRMIRRTGCSLVS